MKDVTDFFVYMCVYMFVYIYIYIYILIMRVCVYVRARVGVVRITYAAQSDCFPKRLCMQRQLVPR